MSDLEGFDFAIETAYGNKLTSPINVTAMYDKAETLDEVPAKERLTPEDELKVINAARKASARAAATTKALSDAGIEKPTLKDENVRLREMTKIFVAAGNTETVAEQKAKAALGM